MAQAPGSILRLVANLMIIRMGISEAEPLAVDVAAVTGIKRYVSTSGSASAGWVSPSASEVHVQPYSISIESEHPSYR